MATVQWGSSDTNPISITSAPGLQFAPAIADNGGTEFGVAWVADDTITVKFFDEQGLPSAALPTTIVTDGVYGSSSVAATVADVHMSAGGVGGYGVVWEESAAGQPSLIQFRYIAETGLFGPEVSVSATASGVNQHDAAVAGYSKDDPTGRPNVEGFAVVWVESAVGNPDQANGQIVFQNIGIALDRRKDPIANPTAAGLDGRPPADPTGGGSNTQTVIGFGRDPSVAVADDGSTAITWVDVSNNIHLRTYDDTGVQVTDITVAGAATAPAGKQHVLALVGGEIVVAWVADADPGAGVNEVVRYEVLAPGAAVGAFAAGPIQTVSTDFPDTVAGHDFVMAALPDGGGFALTWNALDAGHTAIFTSSFTAGGVAMDAEVVHGAIDASGVATAGLVGDRIVAVYEDNSAPGDASNISAQIFDTRTQPNGADILPPGPGEPPNPGLVLIGDLPGGGGGGGGGAAGPPDVLVGTIGNDVIDGKLGADTLDGGLGNDVIVAGAASDIIDGGGNSFVTAAGGTLADGTALATGGDTVIFSGAFSNDGDDTNDDYSITYTGPVDGSGTFIVTDLRAGAPDGIDTIRHVEFFEFVTAEGVHETIRTSDLVGQAATITPVSGWGNDNTFDFLVVHDTLGQQSLPAATGSAEGGPTLAWISNNGVEAQFYTNLGEPQVAAAEVASRVVVNPDPTGKSNVLITDGIAGLAVAWQQDLGSGLSALKMRGLGAEGGVPFGEEITIGDPAFSNHSLQIAGYTFPVGVQVPKPHGDTADTIDGVADGVNAVWVSSVPGDTSGFGQILLQRYEIITDDLGTAVDMLAAGSDGQAEGHDLRTDTDRAALQAAGTLNDDPIVLAARGRDPQVTGLHTGETVVTWIDEDGHVQAQLFPPQGISVPSDVLTATDYTNVNVLLDQIVASVAPDLNGHPNLQVAQLGAGNFAIMWLENGAAGPELHGIYYTLPPDAAALEVVLPGGEGWTAIPIAPIPLHAGFTGEFHLAGLGEDNPDIVLTYTATDVDGTTGVYARHIDGLANGAPEQVFGSSPDFLVNTTTAGNQTGGAVAGMVGDRAIITYFDENTGDTLARIVDIREPGQLLQGDRIRDIDGDGLNAGDRIDGRPDILVGTVGDDIVIGDLVDPALGGIAGVRFDNTDGQDDDIAGGLGNDVLFGGGGSDTIDGGRDLHTPGDVRDPTVSDASPTHYVDTAVFQGNQLDYAVTINGDGSYTVIDARFDDGRNIVDTLADGTANIDGLDFVSNIEQLLFLNNDPNGQVLFDLAYNGITPSLTSGGHTVLDSSALYTLPDEDLRVTGNVDADGIGGAGGIETVETPVGWGLTQEVADHGFDIVGTAGVDDGIVERNPVLATTEGGFVASWLTDAGPGLVAIHVVAFDPIGVPVPVATGGGVIDVTSNARADVPPAVGGIGAGPVATWVETDANGIDHLKLQVYDAAGAPVGDSGGIDVAIAGDSSPGHFSQLAIGNPQLRDVIADGTANDADPVELDDQVAVAWVQDADPSSHNGAIMFQRWAVPTNNDRTTGAPIALGLDGQFNDGNNDPVQLSVTDADGNLHLAVGHSPVITGVESGWTIASWLEDSPVGTHLHGVILDTLTGNQLLEIAPPDAIADGTHAYLFGAGDPSDIVVGWLTPADGGGFDLKASIYKQASDSFISETFTLKHFDTATVPKDVSFAVAGEGNLSLLVTWHGDDGTGIDPTGVHGQRYSFEDGTPVGHTFDVVSGQTTTDSSTLVGLLDGRFGVAYTQQDVGGDVDVHARLFDTNDSIAPIIGRDAGGAADQNPGTVFDDIIDLRDRADEGHGGLGNDVVMGGWNDDVLFGEAGNDVLVGGTGTDILIGDSGDDLLMGNHGRDYVSGGDGIDTISFQGELRAVTIDLAQGVVTSDAAHNAVILPAAGDIVGLPANADTDASIEDLIGLVVTDPVTEVSTFTSTHDVENAYGGLGNDILIGDGNDNVLTGGGGNDTFDGGGGTDTVVLGGSVTDFTFAFDGATFTIADHSHGTTLSATNVELFQFADGIRTAADLSAIIAGGTGNLAPVIGGGDALALTVPENTTAATTVTATDPESSAITFSIAGGSDAASFTINPTTGALSFVAAQDFEHPADVGHNNVYDVIVAASDGFLFDTQAIAVTVSNVAEANNPPVITSNGGNATAAVLVAENTAVVTTVTATDPDGDVLSYSLTGGLDQSKFQINATTGALSFIAAPNFEVPAAAGGGNFYDVIVSVSDGTTSDAQQIAVTVTDVNEAPTITSNGAGPTASVAVAENTAAVTTVTATDADAGANIAYSLAGGADAALFTIDAGSGALSFLAAPDFEAPADANHDNVYDVVVRASDGTLTDTQAIAVTVTDMPDGDIAPAIASPNTASIAENSTSVLTVTAADPDGSSLGFSVVGGADAALFAINAATGALSFLSAPDFEAPADADHDNAYEVIVRASDGTLFDEQEITVNVTNVAGLSLTGTAAANTLSGGGEEDTIIGLGGNDTLSGAGGNDLIDGGAGADNLNGGDGNDTIVGSVGADIINGAGGNDVILYTVGDGGDTIVGDAGLDTLNISGTAGDDTLSVVLASGVVTGVGGGSLSTVETVNADLDGGNDLLSYGATTTDNITVDLAAGTASGFAAISGVENVTSGSGNDLLLGDAGPNSLNGGTGNDTLMGGLGLDTLTGGTGIDTVYYANETDAMVVNLTLNTTSRAADAVVEDVLSGIENAIGGAGGDTITGSTAGNLLDGGAGNDSVDGGAGNDTVLGGEGHDTLIGGAGVDSIDGGAGNDLIIGGAGNDLLSGGLGDDTFTYLFGDGADVFDGGDGSDTLNILGTAGANALAVAWDGISIVSFTGGTLIGIEHLTANLDAGVDVLSYAGATANVTVSLLAGTASGFDSIVGIENVTGGSGNDTLIGDDGANVLAGGAGDDTYFVGAGDTVTEGSAAGIDTVNSTVNFTLGANVENLQLVEGSGDISGTGNTLANVIIGNSGNNTIDGGAGNDSITGGAGDDIMTGGTGNDLFVFAAGFGNDVVNGFDANPTGGQDLLDVTAYHLNAANFAANVSIELSGADTIVHIGVDTITLTGVNGVGANAVTIDDFKLV